MIENALARWILKMWKENNMQVATSECRQVFLDKQQFVEKKDKLKKGAPVTPGKAVVLQCLQCSGSADDIPNCGGDKCKNGQGDVNGVCFLYPHRSGKRRVKLSVIRKFCLECTGGDKKLIRNCLSTDCPLYPYRMGTNPAISAETRMKRSERLEKSILGQKRPMQPPDRKAI